MAFEYEVAIPTRAGGERVHEYASDSELRPGDVILLEGGYWLLERIETSAGEAPARALAKPARYRLELRHPGGRLEAGAFRRFRAGGPTLGHAFTTLEEGQPVSWQVVDQQLTRDEQGEPYLNLVAERDYGELEPLPDHELEHALAREEELPEAAAGLSGAEQAGLAMELVALDPGEEPDWAAAGRFIDSLVLEEVEDDVLELCGVDPRVDPRDTWLETVKGRLRADLERFRADIEGEHDQIEEWDFRGGRIFVSSGSFDTTRATRTAGTAGCAGSSRARRSARPGSSASARPTSSDVGVPRHEPAKSVWDTDA